MRPGHQQAALDVADEQTMAIAPLGVDDALELFAQRAARVLPGWTVTASNRTQTLALVERLDRIPLALELAAVRLRVAPLGSWWPGWTAGSRS